MSSRTYILPSDSYSGTVCGVAISYNAGTLKLLGGIENKGLKAAMEDIVVRAALERGFTSVLIRSIPHSWTINLKGKKVNDAMHITISAGSTPVKGHIYCSGFNPEVAPGHWYDQLRGDYVKWSDRATSSNASNASNASTSSPHSSHGRNTPPTGGGQSSSTGGGQSSSTGGGQSSSTGGPQWVLTGSSVPGQKYRWWNGREYTNNFA